MLAKENKVPLLVCTHTRLQFFTHIKLKMMSTQTELHTIKKEDLFHSDLKLLKYLRKQALHLCRNTKMRKSAEGRRVK